MNADSEDVLKALSNSTRRSIMRQIARKGSATYSEIMKVLGLDPYLMSGKFNYHLKELTEVGLIKKTGEEYRISELGKKAMILLDQVEEERKIDKYGVLSAVLSMSPKQEVSLYMNQMGLVFGFMGVIFSLIIIGISISENVFGWQIGAIVATISILVLGRSMIKVGRMIRRLKVGISAIIFLQPDWFLIRSPNRNNFLAVTIASVTGFVLAILIIALSYSGPLVIPSIEALVMSVIGVVFLAVAVFYFRRAYTHAEVLEVDMYEK
ncbi:MAG: helix-turn-helix domain-containing protein [Candidatus Lokiarchaeota archaeon]|nr:helix-turn-helix domain-containing protein [Candidatus Lokiarchaeota archaeon]